MSEQEGPITAYEWKIPEQSQTGGEGASKGLERNMKPVCYANLSKLPNLANLETRRATGLRCAAAWT